MANTYIRKAFSTTGTSRQKFTLSMWFKRGSGLGVEQMLCECYSGSSAKDEIWLQSNDTINFVRTDPNGLATTTSAVFRDTFGWYNLVISGDTTQASNADRVKIYVNGVQQTLGQQDTIAQNSNFQFGNTGTELTFGMRNATDWYFDGCMSHIHVIDGTAYDASAFGSVDADTGEWSINTSPSVTYGTNGFFILKDGNSVTDSSPNSNNFTVSGGTLTKTEDCPSNVFATLNPLIPEAGGFNGGVPTLANGNTKFTTTNGSSIYDVALSNIGMTSGKYYAECKKISGSQGLIGIRGWQGTSPNNYLGDTSKDYGLYTNGQMFTNNTDTSIGGSSYADNDIIGVFVDCDNWKIYFSKNGTIMNTTGYTIGDITADNNVRSLGAYFFGCCEWNSSGNGVWEWNFGNGAFGSTQLTGTTYNGSDGNGIFKYNPNSITLDGSSKSFKSLSTKGLNS
jgi:hypothetical protein